MKSVSKYKDFDTWFVGLGQKKRNYYQITTKNPFEGGKAYKYGCMKNAKKIISPSL